MAAYRRKRTWLWTTLAVAFFGAFLSTAFTYYSKARREWLAAASAERLLVELNGNPADADVTYTAARKLWEIEGKPKEALPLARRAVELTPARPEAHLLLGFVALSNRLPAEALHHFEKACDLNPKLHHAHGSAGAVYLEAGLPELALPHLNAAWDPRSPSVPVRVNTIEALYQLAQYQEAERLTFDTLTHSPSTAALPYQQLHRINKKLGRPGFVKRMMRDKIRTGFTFTAPFYAELAFIILEQEPTAKGFAEARTLAQKALKVGMDDSEAYSINGAVLARQQRHEEAVSSLKRALSLDPKNRRARALLIASLRSLHQEAEAKRYEPQVKSAPSLAAVQALREQPEAAPGDSRLRLEVAQRLDAAGDYLGAFQVCWAEVRRSVANRALVELADRALWRRIEQRKLDEL